ncbi:unnamed protein product, partial [Iphiclides podalirius]
MSFIDKVVLVTGSSSGIGASAAIEFAKEGAHVVIVGRNETKLKDVREKCEKYGKEQLVLKADVSKDVDGKRIVDETIRKFGRIDVLVNNAGVTEIVDITSENFMEGYDRVVNVNLRGVVYITHQAIPHLIKSKGNIINISSVAATIASSDVIPYNVSKAGLNHFTRCAALKLAGCGVRVNTVSPGPVRTNIFNHPTMGSVTWELYAELTPLKRVSDPVEIAELILFLASDKARGITRFRFRIRQRSGIGASTAIGFAKEGARVVIVGRNEVKLEDVRKKCEKYGKKPLVLKADVSIDSDAKRIVEETVKKFGRMDVLINNAGILEKVDITGENFMEVYDRIINVNLRSTVLITHRAIPHLIKSKGNIVNVSSVAGLSTIGGPDYIAYGVSKAGINYFTRSSAQKLSSYGIRVNTVSPGPVKTDIINNPSMQQTTWEQIAETTTLKRVSEPEEMADLIMYLAGDKAKGITGSNFVADNGILIKN